MWQSQKSDATFLTATFWHYGCLSSRQNTFAMNDNTSNTKTYTSIKIALLIILLIGVAELGTHFYVRHKIYQSHTAAEFSAARQAASQLSTRDILCKIQDAGINDKMVAYILNSSYSIIYRLRTGLTTPTPAFDACVQTVYMDYLILGSWLLVKFKYCLYFDTDLYAGQLNPLQEVCAAN